MSNTPVNPPLFQGGVISQEVALAMGKAASKEMNIAMKSNQLLMHLQSVLNTVANNIASNTIQAGKDAKAQAFAQGFGQMGGSIASLGMVGIGELGSAPESGNMTEEQLEGVNDYLGKAEERIDALTADPAISEEVNSAPESEEGSEKANGSAQEEENEVGADKKQAVKDRIGEIKDKLNKEFLTEDKQVMKTSEQKGSDAEMTDEDMIKISTKDEAEDLRDSLTAKKEELTKQLSDEQEAQGKWRDVKRQKFATLGNGLSSGVQGIGTLSSGPYQEDQAVKNAQAAEAQAALQGIQQVAQQLQSQVNTADQQSVTYVAQQGQVAQSGVYQG